MRGRRAAAALDNIFIIYSIPLFGDFCNNKAERKLRTNKKRDSAAARAVHIFNFASAVGSPSALIITGIASGFINGLLGAGGGVMIVRSADKLLPQDTSRDPRDIYATALAVMLPISAVSTIASAWMGAWQGDGAARMILPALIGGTVGAALLERLQTNILRIIFSAVAAYSGIVMLCGALR